MSWVVPVVRSAATGQGRRVRRVRQELARRADGFANPTRPPSAGTLGLRRHGRRLLRAVHVRGRGEHGGEDVKWYRVEYGARGALVSIEECPKAGPNAMLVIYVQAEDADGARHAAYLERQKMQQRSRHAAYEEQGLCRCGREKPASAKRCDSCLERNRKYNRRKADRAAGRPPRDELAPKKEALAARSSSRPPSRRQRRSSPPSSRRRSRSW